MRWQFVFALAACGRYGFSESEAPASQTDAPGSQSDAQVIVPDGVGAPLVCSQAAPFVALIDVVAFGNPSTQTVRYCYAGLPGPITAQMRVQDDSLFVEATGAIEPAMIDLFIGGANCNSCFIRLLANGLVHDGPITDFTGD